MYCVYCIGLDKKNIYKSEYYSNKTVADNDFKEKIKTLKSVLKNNALIFLIRYKKRKITIIKYFFIKGKQTKKNKNKK
jgi:uncharacterized protein YvpB